MVGAAFGQWRRSKGDGVSSKPPSGLALIAVPIVLPAALGVGVLRLGLPVSAGIQFATGCAFVLVLPTLFVAGAVGERRANREREAAGARDRRPPPGSIVVPGGYGDSPDQ
ncbi:hypothetical protein ACFVUH_05730 [Kitasatospora sp. NPDC058032]|uniref:hypothetical protein n=1 Tax=Kitasatospora sp. NPDC058032 TaxID=3346307 RepID=UPI0036DA9422